MPLVKRLSHKSSTNEKISEGKGALIYQEVKGLLYFLGFFFSSTGIFGVQNQGKSQHYMKYFQVPTLECLHLTQTDHLIWMSPALSENLSLPFFQGYSDAIIYYFQASQYLIFSILMGGCKVPFC